MPIRIIANVFYFFYFDIKPIWLLNISPPSS